MDASGYAVSSVAGSGETSHVFRSIPVDTTKRPVILVHGSGAPYQYIDPVRLQSARFGPTLCRHGWNCLSGTMGGQTWANDASMTHMTNSISYIKSQVGLTGPVHLIGASMGGAVALRYAINNPLQVASYTGLIPLTNLVALYDASSGATETEIATAWGVAAGAALPAGANIHSDAVSLNGAFPSRMYYASDDTVVLPSWVTTVGSGMGSELVDVGALGHSEAAMGQALDLTAPTTLVDFLKNAEV